MEFPFSTQYKMTATAFIVPSQIMPRFSLCLVAESQSKAIIYSKLVARISLKAAPAKRLYCPNTASTPATVDIMLNRCNSFILVKTVQDLVKRRCALTVKIDEPQCALCIDVSYTETKKTTKKNLYGQLPKDISKFLQKHFL